MKFTVNVIEENGGGDFASTLHTDLATDSLSDLDIPPDEKKKLVELRAKKIEKFLSKWSDHEGSFVLEFDTEAGTAVVKEVQR